jgi:signal transduction histidine kinase
MGLFIARQIALAHGGTIRVSSQPGAGSTFVVELPLANGVTAADPARGAEARPSKSASAS